MKRIVLQDLGKKLLLSLAAVSFLTINQSRAQSSSINLGFNLGGNYGNLSSDVGSWSGTVGYQAAAYAEWRINNKFGLGVEAADINLTTNSNYKDSILLYGQTDRINYNTQLNINFLRFTLLFKYYITLGSKPITPYDNPDGTGNYLTLFAGPYYSIVGTNPSNTGTIRLTTHYDTAKSDASDLEHDSILTKGSYNSQYTYDGLATGVYGMVVGAGLNLKIAKGLELTFDARYTRDLVTIDNPLTYTDPKTKITTNYGFLGERQLVFTNSSAALLYSPANAFATFICLNVGLNIRLFEIGG